MNFMKKWTSILTLTTFLSIGAAFTTLAGWQQEGTQWRYENNGSYSTGCFEEINGMIYHFADSGFMDTGWINIDGDWYFFDTDGSMVAGEQLIENRAYTFDHSGKMLYEGIRRSGLEDDLLTDSFIKTHENWDESLHALELINQERTNLNVSLLSLDFDLSLVATYRGAHMNKYNYLGHKYDSIYACDINWYHYSGQNKILSENIHLYGEIDIPNNGNTHTESPWEFTNIAHNQLKHSPGHFKNMIDPLDVKVGIGFYRNSYMTRDYAIQLYSY